MFKIGDKVKCIEFSGLGYFGEVGGIYTISKIDYSSYNEVRVIYLLEDRLNRGLAPDRFELAEETTMKIAGYNVTNIKKDSAKVGCTTVTREQVEQLLKLIDEAKELKTIQGKKYKWIGSDDRFVILCTKSNSSNGVVVESCSKCHFVGEYDTNWNWITYPDKWEMLEE